MSAEEEKEDIAKTIKALVVANGRPMTLIELEREYYELEGTRIPWGKHHCSSLGQFIQSFGQHVRIVLRGGFEHVEIAGGGNSAHIIELIQHQRPPRKKPISRRGGYTRRPPLLRQPYHMYPPPSHPSSTQSFRFNPGYNTGTNYRQNSSSYGQNSSSYGQNSSSYGQNSSSYGQNSSPYPSVSQNSRSQHSSPQHKKPEIKPAGLEDDDGEGSSFELPKEPNKENAAPSNKATCNGSSYWDDVHKVVEKEKSAMAEMENKAKENENGDSELVSERTKIRLQMLIEKHPRGIACQTLPEVYYNEYKVRLNFQALGFDSVQEFAKYFDKIFRCERDQSSGDLILYNGQKSAEELKMIESKRSTTLASLYNIYPIGAGLDRSADAMPKKLSTSTTNRLIPDNVMNEKETVGQFSVTELRPDGDEQVKVVDIFTPSFFWVQVVRYIPKLEALMSDLQVFYSSPEAEKYVVPKILLKTGLNIVAKFMDVWHRGLIETVKVDGRLTILFYDYGTLQTQVGPVYFMLRKFSNIPSVALPCGLYNVRPYSGEKWGQDASLAFNKKTMDKILLANVKSIDEETNSAMIHLKENRGDGFFHIHQYLIDNKYAREGCMLGSVDVQNLLLYEDLEESHAPGQSFPPALSNGTAHESMQVSNSWGKPGNNMADLIKLSYGLKRFRKDLQSINLDYPEELLKSISALESMCNDPAEEEVEEEASTKIFLSPTRKLIEAQKLPAASSIPSENLPSFLATPGAMANFVNSSSSKNQLNVSVNMNMTPFNIMRNTVEQWTTSLGSSSSPPTNVPMKQQQQNFAPPIFPQTNGHLIAQPPPMAVSSKPSVPIFMPSPPAQLSSKPSIPILQRPSTLQQPHNFIFPQPQQIPPQLQKNFQFTANPVLQKPFTFGAPMYPMNSSSPISSQHAAAATTKTTTNPVLLQKSSAIGAPIFQQMNLSPIPSQYTSAWTMPLLEKPSSSCSTFSNVTAEASFQMKNQTITLENETPVKQSRVKCTNPFLMNGNSSSEGEEGVGERGRITNPFKSVAINVQENASKSVYESPPMLYSRSNEMEEFYKFLEIKKEKSEVVEESRHQGKEEEATAAARSHPPGFSLISRIENTKAAVEESPHASDVAAPQHTSTEYLTPNYVQHPTDCFTQDPNKAMSFIKPRDSPKTESRRESRVESSMAQNFMACDSTIKAVPKVVTESCTKAGSAVGTPVVNRQSQPVSTTSPDAFASKYNETKKPTLDQKIAQLADYMNDKNLLNPTLQISGRGDLSTSKPKFTTANWVNVNVGESRQTAEQQKEETKESNNNKVAMAHETIFLLPKVLAKVYLRFVKWTVHVLRLENSSWMVMDEFAAVLASMSVEELVEKMKNWKVETLVISRFQLASIFRQLDASSLIVERTEQDGLVNQLELISFKSIIMVLLGLRLVDRSKLSGASDLLSLESDVVDLLKVSKLLQLQNDGRVEKQ